VIRDFRNYGLTGHCSGGRHQGCSYILGNRREQVRQSGNAGHYRQAGVAFTALGGDNKG
jgi:hypothetical protein